MRGFRSDFALERIEWTVGNDEDLKDRVNEYRWRMVPKAVLQLVSPSHEGLESARNDVSLRILEPPRGNSRFCHFSGVHDAHGIFRARN